MAGKNIKGITIEIDGDNSGLTQALKKVDNETKSVQKELGEVTRLLKLDPTNVELLSQKQKLLGDAIDSTSKRLDALKQAQSEVERQFKSGEIGEEAYRKFQREIIATEGKLEAFKKQAKSVDAKIDVQSDTKVIDKIKSELKSVSDVAKDVGNKIGESLKNGAKVGAVAVAGIGTAAIGATAGVAAFVESQKEMSSDLARLRTNAETAGFSLEEIEKGFKKVASVTGEADSAVETMSNLMATDFSEAQLAEALDYINGAAIKFSDTLKTEGIADGLQETFSTGKAIGPFAELLERSGVNLEQFDKGLAKAAKSGTETDYVLQQLSQLGLASTYEAYLENNSAIADYNLAQVESQKKLAELSDKMRPFVTMLMEMGNIILDVVMGNKSLSEGFGELIKIVQDLADKFLSAAKKAMPSFLQGIKDALPQVLQSGIDILLKVVEGIAKKYPEVMKTALGLVDKIITTIIDNLPKILDSGSKILKSIISGITSNIPNLIATALSLIVKIAAALIQNLPKIINTGIEIIVALVKGLANAVPKIVNFLVTDLIPKMVQIIKDTDWVQIGKDIIQGLINGIGQMLTSAVEAVTKVVKGVVGAAKSLLGINSPSKVFKQIGLWTGEGLAIGIEQSEGSVKNATESMVDGILSATKTYQQEYKALQDSFNKDRTVKNEQVLNKIQKIEQTAAKKKRSLTVQERAEIAKLENEYRNSKLKAEQDFNKKYLALVAKSEKEYLNIMTQSLEEQKANYGMSTLEEAKYWENLIEMFSEGSAERLKVLQNYNKAVDTFNKELQQKEQEHVNQIKAIDDELVKNIQDVTKAYEDAVAARANKLDGFASLFQEFTVAMDVSGQDLTKNLRSQVEAFELWEQTIDALFGRGIISEGLENELSDLGVSALPQLLALNSMTDTQLQEYSNLFDTRSKQARERAEQELIGMKFDTAVRIEEMKIEAGKKLDEVNASWAESMKELTKATSTELDQLKQIGVDAGQGLLNGLASMESPLVDKARQIANAIKATMQSALDIHSPSRVMEGFGINIGQGLIKGMDGMIKKVAQSSIRLSEAVQSAQWSLGSSAQKSVQAATSTTSSSVDNRKSFAPTINVYTTESPEVVMQRTLRKMAFQF